MRPRRSGFTCRISATTRNCPSRPTAACAWLKWKRRPRRCPPAPPPLPTAWSHTCSEKARAAQQSVMEFLLINHLLDCPICDQGGECQLQDLAVGYGGSSSRYQEEARGVPQGPPAGVGRGNEPLHPLHPLRALRPGNRRRHGTGHARPWRTLRDHVLRRPLDRVRAVGQHDRHLSGGRADLQASRQRAHLGAGPPPVSPHDSWAPTWSSRSRATASCAWCRSRTKPSTNAGSATATASRMKA